MTYQYTKMKKIYINSLKNQKKKFRKFLKKARKKRKRDRKESKDSKIKRIVQWRKKMMRKRMKAITFLEIKSSLKKNPLHRSRK